MRLLCEFGKNQYSKLNVIGRLQPAHFLKLVLSRYSTYLGAPDALEDYNLANLGIYGLGKRRTLQQLEQFLDIDIANQVPRPRDVRSYFFSLCFDIIIPSSLPSSLSRHHAWDTNGFPTISTFRRPRIYSTIQTTWIRNQNIQCVPSVSFTRRR